MTFFSSIVKVMKKSETKAEKESQAGGDQVYHIHESNFHNNDRHFIFQEDPEHRVGHVFRRNNYDRHLIEVGCITFTQLFAQYPMMEYLSQVYERIQCLYLAQRLMVYCSLIVWKWKGFV